MKSSFYLQIQSYLSRITGIPVHGTHVSLDHAGLSIFEARERLNAICLKRTSMAFLIILGNLARKALLCKWESPKYCSTIYRTLEIALLRSVSYSVSSAPVVALRMMPSSILFKARNSRFGFPKYPLSANTFLMVLLYDSYRQHKEEDRDCHDEKQVSSPWREQNHSEYPQKHVP